MITKEDEDFLRISLLLIKGGGFISKETLHREIKKSGKTIDTLLTRFERRLKHQFHKKQMQIMFPDSGTTDIEKWDIQMMTSVLLTIFDTTLDDEEKEAIELIKYVRNEVYAHRPPTPMDHSDFEDIRNQLEEAINVLSSKYDKTVQETYACTIKECTGWQLDSASVCSLLEGINHSEDLLQDILKNQKQFSDEIKQNTDDQHERTRKEAIEHRDMILAELGKILKDGERSRKKVLIVLGTEITLQGDKEQSELVDAAEEIITGVINLAIKKADSIEYPSVMQAVQEILKRLEEIPDVEVLPAKHKCIVLEFQCISYDGLFKLLLYLESKDFLDSLENIAKGVGDIQSVTTPYFVNFRLMPESLKEVFNTISNSGESEYLRTVELPIKVTSLGGIAHVCNLFENAGATNSFNEVSEAISTHLGTKITLKPTVNVQQVEGVIRNTDENFPYTAEGLGSTGGEETLSTVIVDAKPGCVAPQDEDDEDTNELFRSLIMIKGEEHLPGADSGFDEVFSNRTGTSVVSSETNEEGEAIDTDLPPRKKKKDQLELTIGTSVNMQQLDDSSVRVSSIGPLVYVTGTDSKCFITVGIKPCLLKSATTSESKRNLKVLASNPEDDTLLAAVDGTETSTEMETAGSYADAALRVQLDRKHLTDGTKVCKVGVSGLAEGMITGTGMISGRESKNNKQSIMYVASLPGSQETPFAENGDAGSAVFYQIDDKWCCIGIVLGVQNNVNSDEELYVVKYIDDVIDEMRKISGKHIGLDHSAMNLQVSSRFKIA